MGQRTCSIEDCERLSHARGWCKIHYLTWYNHGDPTWNDPRRRFLRNVEVTAGGCWRWTGSLCSNGYGRFGIDKARVLAHRYAYEMLVGPIPDGLQLDHLCHSGDPLCTDWDACPHRRCVNPAHLEPVEARENLRRSNGMSTRYARRTHCKNGHALEGGNVDASRNVRDCRACRRSRATARPRDRRRSGGVA